MHREMTSREKGLLQCVQDSNCADSKNNSSFYSIFMIQCCTDTNVL